MDFEEDWRGESIEVEKFDSLVNAVLDVPSGCVAFDDLLGRCIHIVGD
jgi:hypothetical protein